MATTFAPALDCATHSPQHLDVAPQEELARTTGDLVALVPFCKTVATPEFVMSFTRGHPVDFPLHGLNFEGLTKIGLSLLGLDPPALDQHSDRLAQLSRDRFRCYRLVRDD